MAVTFSYVDQGIYHRVSTIGSGTFTDDDLYNFLVQEEIDDVVAPGTYITRTGAPGSYIYTFKLQSGENYVNLLVNSGGTWQREEGATWGWEMSNTSSTYTSLIINPGAVLKLADNCVFNMTINSPTYGRVYIYLYGTVTGVQSLGNEAIFENYRSIYCQMYDTVPWDLDYVIFRNTTYSAGYLLYFSPGNTTSYDGSLAAHSFKHITVVDDGNQGYVNFLRGDFSNWILEDWLFDSINRYWIQDVHSLKFTRLEIKNTTNYGQQNNNGSALTSSRIHTSKTKDWGSAGHNQPMIVYDDCTFDDVDTGVYNFRTFSGGLYLLKSGEMKNASVGMRAEDATIMLYEEPTYTNITTDKQWIGQGTFLHVRKLDLTVNDPSGIPLENARIDIQTKLVKTVGARDYPYEEYSFLTDENGQVKGIVEDSIYLTEQEESSDGVFVQWSDGIGNNVHVITVSHPDYTIDTREVAMTQDRSIVIQLSENPVGTTTIHNATIHNATIY